MIVISVGSQCQMYEKEAQLLMDGYKQVVGPSLGSMEYCRQPEYDGTARFKLCWNQSSSRSRANTSSTRLASMD